MCVSSLYLGFHPATLFVRFLLELAALACFSYGGWKLAPGGLRYLAVAALPLLVGLMWGIFATPYDASRSGEAGVATPGPVRLLLELAVFFGGAAVLYATGARFPALVLVAVLVMYHAVSVDRIVWLLRN